MTKKEYIFELENLLGIDSEEAKEHQRIALSSDISLFEYYKNLFMNWNKHVKNGSIVDEGFVQRRDNLSQEMEDLLNPILI